MVWANVKNRAAAGNTHSVPLTRMRENVLDAFKKVTPEDCRKAVEHCMKIERLYYSYQQIVDADIRPVIITAEVT